MASALENTERILRGLDLSQLLLGGALRQFIVLEETPPLLAAERLSRFHSCCQLGNPLRAGCLALCNVFHITFWKMVSATLRLKYVANVSCYICLLAG